MHTQNELIDLARAAQGNVTRYRISQMLGITSAYMTNLTKDGAVMSAEKAAILADLCRLDAGYVTACIEAQRAARDNRPASLVNGWRDVAERLRRVAAVLTLVGALVLLLPAPAARAASSVAAHYFVNSTSYILYALASGGPAAMDRRFTHYRSPAAPDQGNR